MAEALRATGLTVHTLASVHVEEQADVEWLALAGERGWAVLVKDDSIRGRPAELEALRAAAVKAFCVTNPGLTGQQYGERLNARRHRIVQRCRQPDPFIVGVYENRLGRIWPPT